MRVSFTIFCMVTFALILAISYGGLPALALVIIGLFLILR